MELWKRIIHYQKFIIKITLTFYKYEIIFVLIIKYIQNLLNVM